MLLVAWPAWAPSPRAATAAPREVETARLKKLSVPFHKTRALLPMCIKPNLSLAMSAR